MTGMVMITRGAGCAGAGAGSGAGDGGGNRTTKGGSIEEQNQLSLVALLIAALRKSMVACRVDHRDDQATTGALNQMEIGWPTNVQHLTHVTFDRFHGFLGLPVEFEVEIPCRVPSARC